MLDVVVTSLPNSDSGNEGSNKVMLYDSFVELHVVSYSEKLDCSSPTKVPLLRL